MSKIRILLCVLCLNFLLFGADKFPPLPAAVSNNAVATVKVKGNLLLFSFMGIGSKKTWDTITNAAYSMDVDGGKWLQIRPVPGTAGRIAASAMGAREQVFLLGGYVVDAQGSEITVSDVNVYEPLTDRWYRGTDLPVPIDDSVVGVYRNRYLYVISGWSKNDAVRDVQIYDAEKDHWLKGTPITGTPVFGHAGALLGDTIVYADGAHKSSSPGQPKYVPSDECWMGKIDHKDPTKIVWTKLPAHPGNARYRIAAGGSEKDGKIYFSGGTDNPYNYDGVGYDGKPSEPSPVTFAFNMKSGKWETIEMHTPNPTMDHRGLIALSQGLVVIGGMEAGQKVTANVNVIPRQAKSK
jgi:N-acetylneuraminic acid mutarotase